MDDKRIEDMLRDSWQPSPPDGMRDRTLRLARQELANRKRVIFGMSRWKIALVTLGIAIVVFTNIAGNAREERMAAMMGGSACGINSHFSAESYLKMRRAISEMQARVPTCDASNMDERECPL